MNEWFGQIMSTQCWALGCRHKQGSLCNIGADMCAGERRQTRWMGGRVRVWMGGWIVWDRPPFLAFWGEKGQWGWAAVPSVAPPHPPPRDEGAASVAPRRALESRGESCAFSRTPAPTGPSSRSGASTEPALAAAGTTRTARPLGRSLRPGHPDGNTRSRRRGSAPAPGSDVRPARAPPPEERTPWALRSVTDGPRRPFVAFSVVPALRNCPPMFHRHVGKLWECWHATAATLALQALTLCWA